MAAYVLRRILMLIPVMLGVSILVFLIIHLSPGDPARLILGERGSDRAVGGAAGATRPQRTPPRPVCQMDEPHSPV